MNVSISLTSFFCIWQSCQPFYNFLSSSSTISSNSLLSLASFFKFPSGNFISRALSSFLVSMNTLIRCRLVFLFSSVFAPGTIFICSIFFFTSLLLLYRPQPLIILLERMCETMSNIYRFKDLSKPLQKQTMRRRQR